MVIYLTGAPAVGKSTLCDELSAHDPSIKTFSYSTLLLEELARSGPHVSITQLREKSASLITLDMVDRVDSYLLDQVKLLRSERHIVVDSHAVTKEKYGFRVSAFKRKQLFELAPDIICLLYTNPVENQKRIEHDAEGRPDSGLYSIEMHSWLQSQVALFYALELGARFYALDNTNSDRSALRKIQSLLQ